MTDNDTAYASMLRLITSYNRRLRAALINICALRTDATATGGTVPQSLIEQIDRLLVSGEQAVAIAERFAREAIA